MNKYILSTLLCTALSAPLFTSCELDQMPYNSLPSEETWQNLEQVQRHYLGLQSSIRSVSGGSISYITDIQADLFNATAGAASYNRIHQWTFTGEQFEGDAVWANNYSLVNEANDILGHIGNFEGYLPEVIPSTNDSLFKGAQVAHTKAAAYFAIAYAYSNMVVRYAKDYEPATAATELGLPILRKVDDQAKPARATLKETYDFIYENIQNALDYYELQDEYVSSFKDDPATPGKNEANLLRSDWDEKYSNIYNTSTYSTLALKTRVDLYTHNFDEAIELSQDLINIGTYSLQPSNQLIYQWVLDGDNDGSLQSEIILMPLQTTDERTGSYGLFVSYDVRYDELNQQYYIHGFNPSYIPTRGLIDLYEDNDSRKQIYFHDNLRFGDMNLTSTSNGAEGEGLSFWKFPGNPNLLKTPGEWSSVICNMAKSFRIAEQYLIIAESCLRKDNIDEGRARTILNELRSQRGASSIGDEVSGADLMKEMKDEWTREFVGEGFRLDCLKRWHEGFKRMKSQQFDQPLLINNPGYQNLDIAADNIRFVWEIPVQDLQTNPNLVPNWK